MGLVGFSNWEYKPKQPASDSSEWIERFKKSENRYYNPLGDLYAELPADGDWGEIIEVLLPVTEKTGEKTDLDETQAQKAITAHLLEGNTVKAREVYIQSLPDKKLPQWSYDQHVRNLHKLGYTLEQAKKTIEHEPKAESKNSPQEWQRLLSNDQIDDAIVALEKVGDFESYERIYRIGKLFERDKLINTGLDGMLNTLNKQLNKRSNFISLYDYSAYFDALSEQKQFKKIIKLFKGLENIKKTNRYGLDRLAPAYVKAIYEEQGAKKTLNTLKNLPKYDIPNQDDYLTLFLESNPHQIALVISKAYLETEQPEKALSTIKYALLCDGGNDHYYKFFLENFPEEEPFLNELLLWNPYQERPLIWMGHQALNHGELEKAQEYVERAIALDPSDGEQGKDTRMEVYNVLSKIHEAKGELQKAAFFKEVMLAIRAGEVADDYLSLGLYDKAIQRYKSALAHFEDAYCLQSRLAKTLLEKGNLKEAEKHFQKAFELMPVSFGPVESHCFGCEGIFKSKESQKIAEKVFKNIIAQSPGNPRTYYLIGKLYEEQKKDEEAFLYYLEAFKRDPNYYNCAQRLYGRTLIDSEFDRNHPNLRKQIMDCYPYSDLKSLFEKRVDLKQNWKDAYSLASSRKVPIKLPQLSLPFTPLNIDSFHCFDGWEGHELLRENSFLSYQMSF